MLLPGARRQPATPTASVASSSSERSTSRGMAKASTRSTAIGRTLRHSALTSRLIALERAHGQPAVLHEPGPVGLDRAQGVEVAEQVEGDLVVAVRHGGAILSTNASSTSRSTCARAAAMTWSWTSEKTSPGFAAGVDARA